jgi:predicted transposase/invertase (TIGR01784 family)
MPNARTLISLDWAMKKILRNKANFDILEGFLSELLKKDVKIKSILESESNREDETDKQNRVDILAENENGEIVIIEVQFANQADYFHRMLYSASKALTERIERRMSYKNIVKVYSVNIVYFPLGDGSDYVYHGTCSFTGLHSGNTLELTEKQKKFFLKENIEDLFPEYYILDVKRFNDIAKDPLDEWIYYLKNYKIEDSFNAKGLKAANEKLKYYALSESEQRAYDRMVHYERIEMSEIETAFMDGEEKGLMKGIEKGRKEGRKEGIHQTALNLLRRGYSVEEVSVVTNMTLADVKELQKQSD